MNRFSDGSERRADDNGKDRERVEAPQFLCIEVTRMKFRRGEPDISGEYIAVMETAAGPQIEIVNYGRTEKSESERTFYVSENGETRLLRNVIAWAAKPDLGDFRR